MTDTTKLTAALAGLVHQVNAAIDAQAKKHAVSAAVLGDALMVTMVLNSADEDAQRAATGHPWRTHHRKGDRQ